MLWIPERLLAVGTKRLRAFAQRRVNSATSLRHFPPVSMANTITGFCFHAHVRGKCVLWLDVPHVMLVTSAGAPGYDCSALARATPWMYRLPAMLGGVKGKGRVITSIRRWSRRLAVSRFKSGTRTLVVTRAPASRRTRASALSSGPALLPKAPDVPHAARWQPERGRKRRSKRIRKSRALVHARFGPEEL